MFIIHGQYNKNVHKLPCIKFKIGALFQMMHKAPRTGKRVPFFHSHLEGENDQLWLFRQIAVNAYWVTYLHILFEQAFLLVGSGRDLLT